MVIEEGWQWNDDWKSEILKWWLQLGWSPPPPPDRHWSVHWLSSLCNPPPAHSTHWPDQGGLEKLDTQTLGSWVQGLVVRVRRWKLPWQAGEGWRPGEIQACPEEIQSTAAVHIWEGSITHLAGTTLKLVSASGPSTSSGFGLVQKTSSNTAPSPSGPAPKIENYVVRIKAHLKCGPAPRTECRPRGFPPLPPQRLLPSQRAQVCRTAPCSSPRPRTLPPILVRMQEEKDGGVVDLLQGNLKVGEALRRCPGYNGTAGPRGHTDVGEGGVVHRPVLLNRKEFSRVPQKSHLLPHNGQIFQVNSCLPSLSGPEFPAKVLQLKSLNYPRRAN